MRVLSALVCILVGVGSAAGATAQRALEVTKLQEALPAPLLTLRPEDGLRPLALEVAAVLELRTGQRVEVGDPPPPGLLEAVPTGNVALAREGRTVLLVIGAPGGRSFDARVRLQGNHGPSDARALALAAETLRDTATELARTDDAAALPRAQPAVPSPHPEAMQKDDQEGALVAVHAAHGQLADEGPTELRSDVGGLLGQIAPLAYMGAYSGASTSSTGPTAGLSTGFGLCAQNNCLFVAAELPLALGTSGPTDVRYRYLTFESGFYARPVSFGAWTPGARVGFFTRLGHFEADMGLPDQGLDTDLGARGSIELAWEFAKGLDAIAEGGVDLTLDRHRVAANDQLVTRGDRWSPWAQLALRYRL